LEERLWREPPGEEFREAILYLYKISRITLSGRAKIPTNASLSERAIILIGRQNHAIDLTRERAGGKAVAD